MCWMKEVEWKRQAPWNVEAKHRNAPIILVGGRGRLSSIQAAELNGDVAASSWFDMIRIWGPKDQVGCKR